MTDISTVLAALDTMVLERRDDGWFAAGTTPPAWCHALGLDALRGDGAIAIDTVFPFLVSFLPHAAPAWATEHAPPMRSEFWVEVDRDGNEVHLAATAVRVGQTRVLVITREDQEFFALQQRLQKARELRMTHDALMREIERKDILLHTIIHDLAAPLHSIVGALSLLDEMSLPEGAHRWLTIALEASARQRDLVDGILDVFSAEYGVVVGGDRRAVALRTAIDRAVSEREPVAKRHRVTVRSPLVADLEVNVDEVRLIRVLTNLLDNAIRHAPPSSDVELHVTRVSSGVRIAVEDRGPGVAREMLPRLFQKLGRDSSRASSHGLGLYFCRITVEQWGGGIGYEPREGGGARFWIRLPLAQKAG